MILIRRFIIPTKGNNKLNERIFFSIREVSDLLGVRDYVLRYWEQEFPQLNPQKGRGGRRKYVAEDIALLRKINRLLYVEKYTIKGARQVLARGKAPKTKPKLMTKLKEMKRELEDILSMLD